MAKSYIAFSEQFESLKTLNPKSWFHEKNPLIIGFLSGLGTHLFVKVPRPGDSEGTPSVIESSFHLLLYQSNHSKVEAIPLNALPKDTTNELADLSPH